MTQDDLKMEIGSEAYSDLSDEEVAFIVNNYDDVKLAAMKSFEILWKKFQPTYRLGRLYEASSDKYLNYRSLYVHYSNMLGVGRSTSAIMNVVVRRGKFLD